MRCRKCKQTLTKLEEKWLGDICSLCDRKEYVKNINDKNRLQKNDSVAKEIND